MPKILEGTISAEGFRFAIVVSRFNEFISSKLVEGAMDALRRHGATEERVSLIKVPGSFEIPLTAKKLAESGQYDAIVCLGAVIRGPRHILSMWPQKYPRELPPWPLRPRSQ